MMTRGSEYFNLNIFRGASFVTSYPFNGTKIAAKAEAARLVDQIHAGATASVENKSGLIVAVVK